MPKSSRRKKVTRPPSRRGASGGKPSRPKYSNKTDKHILYQLSVQDPTLEVEFMEKAYRALHKKSPLSFREDFCGAALLCAEWVQSKKGRTAVGVDIDPKVLKWGTKHNLAPLGEPGDRIELLSRDVRIPTKQRFDVINALNFSYWVFKQRKDLAAYFRSVRASLKPGGIFVCDAYGGWEALKNVEDSRSVKRAFRYVWDQHSFDPIDHSIVNFIHFRFKNGRHASRAFRYDWRFWTLPELRDLFEEAGFRNIQVYWDQAEDADSDDYRPTKHAENQPAFVAYFVAQR